MSGWSLINSLRVNMTVDTIFHLMKLYLPPTKDTYCVFISGWFYFGHSRQMKNATCTFSIFLLNMAWEELHKFVLNQLRSNGWSFLNTMVNHKALKEFAVELSLTQSIVRSYAPVDDEGEAEMMEETTSPHQTAGPPSLDKFSVCHGPLYRPCH